MKKILSYVLPVKSLAALIFAGLVCAYMVCGWLYSAVTKVPFNYTIPFVFLLQGLVLSVVIAVLWGVLLGDRELGKLRYLPRLIIFCLALFIVLALCLSVFFAVPTDWAKLWLIVAGLLVAGVVVLSLIGERYFHATGQRYTAALRDYQAKSV